MREITATDTLFWPDIWTLDRILGADNMTNEEYEEYEKEYEKRIELLEKEREKYTEEEIGPFAKYMNFRNLPKQCILEPKDIVITPPKEVVHYGDWQPPKELLEEYKEEIEAFHKWAESSRQYRDKNGKK